MKFIRFVFPFLFERNWVTGAWELSRSRLLLFLMGIVILVAAIIGAILLQTPVVYEP